MGKINIGIPIAITLIIVLILWVFPVFLAKFQEGAPIPQTSDWISSPQVNTSFMYIIGVILIGATWLWWFKQ